MRNERRNYGSGIVARIPAIVGAALLLAACGDHSASGSYVSRAAYETTLLQITETPDHRFTGTLSHASLNKDGTLSSSTANVSGSVDGSSITLTVLATPLPLGQNFSGTISVTGIDITIASGAQPGVVHFAKGSPSDFGAMVHQLGLAGQPIIAARQHNQQVNDLNRRVNSLTRELNTFVALARKRLEQNPTAAAYYARAVSLEQAKLERAQRLAATGNPVAQGQAGVIVGQMAVDKAQVSTVDDSITQAETNESTAATRLNAEISKWKEVCPDEHNFKLSDAVPDMHLCKELSGAIAAYNAVLPQLRDTLEAASRVKEQAHTRFATIWQAADTLP